VPCGLNNVLQARINPNRNLSAWPLGEKHGVERHPTDAILCCSFFSLLNFVPIKVTIVPYMVTPNVSHSIASALFTDSRRVLLGLFYAHPDERYYLRQVAQLRGSGWDTCSASCLGWSQPAYSFGPNRGVTFTSRPTVTVPSSPSCDRS